MVENYLDDLSVFSRVQKIEYSDRTLLTSWMLKNYCIREKEMKTLQENSEKNNDNMN